MLWNIIFPGWRLFSKYLVLPIICSPSPPSHKYPEWQLNVTAFSPQFTEGEWQVGFSENKYLTKPSFWGVTSKLSIQSIKSNVLHYSLVNVLISNRAELGQLPHRRLNDPTQMSPLLRSLPAPQGRARSLPFRSHTPLFTTPPPGHGTPMLYFICVYVCLHHQTGSPMADLQASVVEWRRAHVLQ